MKQPLLDRDFPDPHVLATPSGLYLYGTETAGLWNVQVAVTRDGVHAEHLGDALPTLPTWARRGKTWAPRVIAHDGLYLMYFTAWHEGTLDQAIGVAWSDRPEGPFIPYDLPLLVGFIDADVFRDDDGSLYLFYAGCGETTGGIWGQRLTPDGLSLWGLSHLKQSAWRLDEEGVVEAPCVFKHDGRYIMLYSVAPFDTPHYAVHYAEASAPLGSYRKPDDNTVLAGPSGPGHCDVTCLNPDESLTIVYHAWRGPIGYGAGGYRAAYSAPLTWRDGRPVVEHGA